MCSKEKEVAGSAGFEKKTPTDIGDIGGKPKWDIVPSLNLQEAPFNAIARLRVRASASERGTGWLVGNNTILTAAHIFPDGSAPNQTVEYELSGLDEKGMALSFLLPADFGKAPKPDPWDIAVVQLPSRNRPRMETLPLQGQPPGTISVVGFPGTSSMVLSTGILVVPMPGLWLHKADTLPGHSGAPIVIGDSAGGFRAVGIHVWGFGGNPYADKLPGHNVGLPMSTNMMTFVRDAVSAWG